MISCAACMISLVLQLWFVSYLVDQNGLPPKRQTDRVSPVSWEGAISYGAGEYQIPS